MKHTYYYCYIPGRAAPRKKHPTIKEARIEAVRLAEQEGANVEILQCVAVTEMKAELRVLEEESRRPKYSLGQRVFTWVTDTSNRRVLLSGTVTTLDYYEATGYWYHLNFNSCHAIQECDIYGTEEEANEAAQKNLQAAEESRI